MHWLFNYLRWLLTVWTYPLRMLMYAPWKWFGGKRRLPQISLPMRVALLMWLVLVIVVVVTMLIFWHTTSRTRWDEKATWGFWMSTVVLVFLIPFVLYKTLLLWLEGPSSPYPEIDRDWKAGLQEMQRKGLNLRQIPLILVLGSTSEQQERTIFESAGREFLVKGTPEGNATLRWYANADVAYVVASQICCLSGLGQNVSRAKEPALDTAPAAAAAAQPADIRQTVPVGGVSRPPRRDADEAALPVRQQAPSFQNVDSMRQTVVGPPSPLATAPLPGSSPLGDRPIALDKSYFDDQRKRLGWLCRLVRKHRLPFAPINGVLALLPFAYVQSSKRRKVLADSLRYDLEQVLDKLMIRCPVTVLVTDTDEEPGYREFVRRMVRSEGAEYVKEHRFGSSFPLDTPATPARVEKLSHILGAAFELWVYKFFHDEESILRFSNNASLYSFLAKLRQSVKNLATICGSFANLYPKTSATTPSPPDTIFFAGCYFAGTGKAEERRVFLKKVLEKPIAEQEELEWTADALRSDANYQWWGLVVSAVDTVLVVALVIAGVVWWQVTQKSP